MITTIGGYWKLTYSVRSRNDTRSYHVSNIDETYIEGHPCLDDLTSLDEVFSRSISERQGTSWYSILHELLFQDELALYGRHLKDELDLPYPSIFN